MIQVSKKPRLTFKFLSKNLENRYHEYNIGHMRIIFGRTVAGDEFVNYGLVKLFEDLGMLSLIQLPNAYYHSLVQEFMLICMWIKMVMLSVELGIKVFA